MSDWWSKKLAGEPPTPQRSPLPPVQAPVKFPPAQAPQVRQPQPSASPEALPEGATLSDYLRTGATRGGKATRTETAICPECGGNYVFSRNTGTAVNPAPRCYECGWNGLYSQADQVSWSGN